MRGVREISTSVRRRSWLPLVKSRPSHGMSARKGILLLLAASTSWKSPPRSRVSPFLTLMKVSRFRVFTGGGVPAGDAGDRGARGADLEIQLDRHLAVQVDRRRERHFQPRSRYSTFVWVVVTAPVGVVDDVPATAGTLVNWEIWNGRRSPTSRRAFCRSRMRTVGFGDDVREAVVLHQVEDQGGIGDIDDAAGLDRIEEVTHRDVRREPQGHRVRARGEVDAEVLHGLAVDLEDFQVDLDLGHPRSLASSTFRASSIFSGVSRMTRALSFSLTNT